MKAGAKTGASPAMERLRQERRPGKHGDIEKTLLTDPQTSGGRVMRDGMLEGYSMCSQRGLVALRAAKPGGTQR